MKPEKENLYEAFRKKSGKMNPLLAAMYQLKEPEEIDQFIADFSITFENGGRHRAVYNHDVMRDKNGGRIKNLVYNKLSSIFYPFQDEIKTTRDGEKGAENWENCLKKLVS